MPKPSPAFSVNPDPLDAAPDKAALSPRLWRVLRLRVWIAEHIRLGEAQVLLVWAAIIGVAGAVASVLFRQGVRGVHFLATGQDGGIVESFSHLAWWWRCLLPAFGGLCAGGILHLGMRIPRSRSMSDYMEAIVIGDGEISSRSSLVKCGSALCTIASGGSIGREGPLVQLAAMLAALVGRVGAWPIPSRRVLVACGAAAGIASAYNAPIAGALFVAEVVLGSLAMETFGPLVLSSVMATITVRALVDGAPLYGLPAFHLRSNWEIVPYLGLGLSLGLIAPWFLRLLRWSERAFTATRLPAFARLALGGLIVGLLAIYQPEVCGNGYSTVNSILHGGWLWHTLAVVLICKLMATAATFGSGAVGGVFTPTLFGGASLGYLFGLAVQHVWPGASDPSAFALVGMGAFLAATTHAPLTAILMVFELTLDYDIILPLMLACIAGYYTAASLDRRSIYSASLARKGSGSVDARLASLRVRDLLKPDPPAVLLTASFDEVARALISHRFNYLYVVDVHGGFRGVISLHDVKSYLGQQELAGLLIANDLLRDDFPTIGPEAPLTEALETFAQHDGERLPVVEAPARKLIGRISKTDLFLALAARRKEVSSPSPPAPAPPAEPAASG